MTQAAMKVLSISPVKDRDDQLLGWSIKFGAMDGPVVRELSNTGSCHIFIPGSTQDYQVGDQVLVEITK